MYESSPPPLSGLYVHPESPWAAIETSTRIHAEPNHGDRFAAIAEVIGRESVLYAIRTRDDLIKLGCTQNLAERRRKLGGEILAFMSGGYPEEKRMHDQLVEHRAHHREWYHPTPEVLSVVNMMRAVLGIESIAA